MSPYLMALLTADNLIQSVNDMRKFVGANTADLLSYPLSRQRTNLADFYPRLLRELGSKKLVRKREARSGFLAGKRHCDDGTGAIVENILA